MGRLREVRNLYVDVRFMKNETVISRDGERGKTTGGERPCQCNWCSDSRVGVRWADGKLTWPCSGGMEWNDNKKAWQIL